LPCRRGERREALEYGIGPKGKYPVLNSRKSLRAMIENDRVCHDDILINVYPNGKITRGCYVKSRGMINCGFTPVAETSGSSDVNIGSWIAGCRIFLYQERQPSAPPAGSYKKKAFLHKKWYKDIQARYPYQLTPNLFMRFL
jgi:hypothetical protein